MENKTIYFYDSPIIFFKDAARNDLHDNESTFYSFTWQRYALDLLVKDFKIDSKQYLHLQSVLTAAENNRRITWGAASWVTLAQFIERRTELTFQGVDLILPSILSHSEKNNIKVIRKI